MGAVVQVVVKAAVKAAGVKAVATEAVAEATGVVAVQVEAVKGREMAAVATGAVARAMEAVAKAAGAQRRIHLTLRNLKGRRCEHHSQSNLCSASSMHIRLRGRHHRSSHH